MNQLQPGNWRQRAASAVVLVLLVAVGARVAWEVLSPLVPGLVVIGLLLVLYSIIIGRFRR